ncbi:hypothetical protein EXU57_22455 [Segetibacter sp. 3557_3]|uniref:hypothetical protein n=1 Tax=Segetibacter sp. 3557_3 TaxID=2547429 RepID=UPI001058AA85|nr:hypothetical protein [Segetibacter sp. 3557_3]TDH19821.1 hypothetical protein EXU57_22455 [Segetibacter sp. 3557_3]
MKAIIVLVIILSACNRPMQVTTRVDPHTSTGGTLGSAQFNNKLPALDTTQKPARDTMVPGRDTTIKKRDISPGQE